MSKARIYGAKAACVPNREVDMRRRNKAFRRGAAFVENEPERVNQMHEKKSRAKKRNGL